MTWTFFTVCCLRRFLTQPQRFTAAQTAGWICAKFPHLNREVQEPLVIFPKSSVRIKQNLVSASLERQQSLYINLQYICCSTRLYIQDLHLAGTTISPVTGRKESGSVAKYQWLQCRKEHKDIKGRYQQRKHLSLPIEEHPPLFSPLPCLVKGWLPVSRYHKDRP